MWQFIIPTLISTIGGAVSSGVSARQAETQNQNAATAAKARRAELRALIDQVRQTDYRNMERAASAQFSQASDQIEALTAGRGTFGSGETGARNLQTRAFSDILTGLAAQKQQDELQRQQLVANILGDQSFMIPDPSAFNPQAVGNAAALGGGAAGLASGAAAFFATDAGQAWLSSLGGQAGALAAPTAQAAPSMQRSGVRAPTVPVVPNVGVSVAPSAPIPVPAYSYQPYTPPMPTYIQPFPYGGPRLVP